MFQDIEPHVFHNEFTPRDPEEKDYMIIQKGRDILAGRIISAENPGTDPVSKVGAQVWKTEQILPTVEQVREICPEAAQNAYYLFSIDQKHFFCSDYEVPETEDLGYTNIMTLRRAEAGYQGFGGSVGWQLASWYHLHRYCGRCGSETNHSDKERAIVCPKCGHVYYPRISPVVIIAIVDGDRILLTRYNRSGYRRHALVAGFVEIGETLEEAVRREVMEEVGLHVKNIRYCESQPWPFSSSLIAGFFADVDGDPTIRLNADGQEELSEGIWVTREELVLEETGMSLTWDMIRKFKENDPISNA